MKGSAVRIRASAFLSGRSLHRDVVLSRKARRTRADEYEERTSLMQGDGGALPLPPGGRGWINTRTGDRSFPTSARSDANGLATSSIEVCEVKCGGKECIRGDIS